MKTFSLLLFSISLIMLTSCTPSAQKDAEEAYRGSPEQLDAKNIVEMEKLTNPDAMTKFDQTADPKSGDEIAVITTNKGVVKIRLFPEYTPKTVANFKKLADEKFYNGLIFHRVIESFMIQGGDPKGDGTGGPGYTVPAELNANLVHHPGALATARLGDQVNPEKASSGSQFYIVHGDARFLDRAYTVFGQVFEGMDIVDTIATVETDRGDMPLEDIVMEKVEIEKY